MLLLAGCGGSRVRDVPVPDLPPPPASNLRPSDAALQHPDWHVALIAGHENLDTAEAVLPPLSAALQAVGVPADRIQPLTGAEASRRERADADRADRKARKQRAPDAADDTLAKAEHGEAPRPGGRQPGDPISATPGSVLRHLLMLGGRARDAACLVYLGGDFDDDEVTLAGGKVSVSDLDRALGGGCGGAPTIVVASGCGSGVLAKPPFARDTRIVIAASETTHNFGCGPNRGLSTFEECLLGSLDGAARWGDMAERITRCVMRRESLVGQPIAPPVVAIGGAVTAMPTPWSGAPALAHTVSFRAGIGRFAADDAPYYSVLKARTRAAFDAYARAARPKAMALTLAGTVEFVSAQHGETAEDVARLALERCEYASDGACSLYARDEILSAPDANGLIPVQWRNVRGEGGRQFDPASVPFVRDDQRRALAAYLTLAPSKALALSPSGEIVAIGTGTTPDAANDAALGKCRAAGGGDCVLYASGGTVVLK